MAGLKDVVLMRFVPERAQTGLALLRVWTGATLFLRHGLEKQPAHWVQFMAHFPDPVGIGSHPSFFDRVLLRFRLRNAADDRSGDALGCSLLLWKYLCRLGFRPSLRVLRQGSRERSRGTDGALSRSAAHIADRRARSTLSRPRPGSETIIFISAGCPTFRGFRKVGFHEILPHRILSCGYYV